MKESLRKINIRGPKDELKKVIDALKSTGSFEQTSVKISNSDETYSEVREELATKIARVKHALDFISKGIKSSGAPEIQYKELKSMTDHEDFVLNIVDAIEKAETKSREIKTKIDANKNMIAELQAYAALDASFNILNDTRDAFVLAGKMPTEQLRKFKSDVSPDNIIIEEYPSSSNNTVIVCIGHKDNYPIMNTIYNYEFERCKFNFPTTAVGKIQELTSQNTQMSEERQQQKQFGSSEDINTLKMYYDFLNNELDTDNVANQTLQTKDSFILNGWIAEKDEDIVAHSLSEVSPEIQYKLSAADENDSPPVLLRSNPIVRPYHSITNLYGQPGKNDIDPNKFVAFFYFLFFGIMIGDIGYGIVMSVATFVFLMVKKPKGGMKNLVALVCMGGISAILWGLVFGSLFGTSTADLLPGGFIDPIEDALIFMGIALGLGVLHLIAGITLNFYNLLLQRKITDAFCDAFSRIVLFAGIICLIAGMLITNADHLVQLGTWIVIGALAFLFLTAGRNKKGILGKVQGGFGGIYSLVGYFGDVLSYARLFALGLVGAVIAMVANTLGGLFVGIPILGWPLAFLIAFVFHAFNLALGILSAYVHNARLQFVEFFGKFYKGGGREFVPIGKNMKYVIIKTEGGN